MSEEASSKITSVVKTEKNPGRVAAGKRLAAISKEAKERKKLERENVIREESRDTEDSNMLVVIGLIATVLVGTVAYFLKRESNVQIKESEEPKLKQKRSYVPYSMAENP